MSFFFWFCFLLFLFAILYGVLRSHFTHQLALCWLLYLFLILLLCLGTLSKEHPSSLRFWECVFFGLQGLLIYATLFLERLQKQLKNQVQELAIQKIQKTTEKKA